MFLDRDYPSVQIRNLNIPSQPRMKEEGPREPGRVGKGRGDYYCYSTIRPFLDSPRGRGVVSVTLPVSNTVSIVLCTLEQFSGDFWSLMVEFLGNI